MAKLVTPYSLAKDGEKKLSANFRVREFKCKDGSDPIFISGELITVLQKIRDHYGKAVVINSAYRTPAYNKKVGGVAQSQHCYGTAADIKISGVTPAALYAWIDANVLKNTGGLGLYSTFVHVDVRKVKARWKNA